MTQFYPPDSCPVLPVSNEDNVVTEYVRHLRAQVCLASSPDVPMGKLCNMHNALRHLLGTPTFLTDMQVTVYLDDEFGNCSGAVAQYWEWETETVRRVEFSFTEGKTWAVTAHPTDPTIFNREELVDIPDETSMDSAAETILKALEAISLGVVRFPEL